MRIFSKKTVIFLAALLIVFLLAIWGAHSKYQNTFAEKILMTVVGPVENAVSRASYSVVQAGSSTGQLFTAYHDNQTLRAENEKLRQKDINVSEIMAENARLRVILDYKKGSTQFDLVTATVIARDPGSWTNIILINRGAADGIVKDMSVITPQGLVGNVISVYNNSAKVQLILDPRSAVGVLVQRPESRVAAIVEGYAANPLTPLMVNMARDADILKGDQIITSGFGGIYPKGLLVGEVADIVNEEGGLLKHAILKPAVDFNRLEEVMVIRHSTLPPVLPPVNPAASDRGAKP